MNDDQLEKCFNILKFNYIQDDIKVSAFVELVNRRFKNSR